VDKRQQRTDLIAARVARFQAQSAEQTQQQNDAVVAAALTNRHLVQACEHAGTIASYESFGTEPPTRELNAELRRMGATVVVPRYEDEQGTRAAHLSWHILSDAGIHPEPIAEATRDFQQLNCAALVIPALAIGRDGSRLGRGGGYYDRTLSPLERYPLGPIRIAIVYEDEVFATLPRESHDELVDEYLAISLD
jgi:5-formyltetrahydrofolate cyclo-ligase